MSFTALAPSPASFLLLRDRLRAASYQELVPLQMTVWATQEPVSFTHRFQGTQTTVSIGETWGKKLFDCAWFRLTAELPPSFLQHELVARIDVNGELLIVDGHGRPLRALTNVTSEFARAHGEPGKVDFPLTPEMIVQGRVELWADAAFNDLFGGVQGDGKIVQAIVCAHRADIKALYFDFEVLCDVLEAMADDIDLCARVNASLEAAGEHLRDGFDADSVAAARAALAAHFAPSDKTDDLRVWAVGHAHLDLAWLWPIRETIRKGARTFATALANHELYPEHILGMSQPQLYAWMKTHYPEFYARIKQGVRDGSIELQGRFWVEPDCNIPNGESLVRQVVYGAQFFREEFGFVPAQCWQPDVFGYNGQLPQILAKSGHDAFMTQKLSWNLVNRFPHHSFHWEGIDGTSILTHMLPEETYNGPAAPKSLKKIRDEYAQRDVSGHALMCFGIGDGGAGPGMEHLERLRRLRAFETLPEVKIEPTPDFFAEWRKDAEKFPRWKGELYLERHQGTLTTQALTKKNNRHCEIALRELEWLSVLAENLGGHPYPTSELQEIWREVLLYQFHDVLPGSSIKRVYDECTPRYAAMLERIETLARAALENLAPTLNVAGAQLAFNALSTSRTDWVSRHDQWHQLRTPALGWAIIPVTPTAVTGTLSASDRHLENDLLRVEFAADGTLSSIRRKNNPQELELLAPGETANALCVYPDRGDAWDFDADIPNKNVWLYLAETPQRPVLHTSSAKLNGPHAIVEQVYKIGRSTIQQRIVLAAGAELVEFEHTIDWQEPAHLLKVVFPTSISAETARFEIPFGSLHRSTREDDSVSKAQFEVPGHQWIDLSQADRGLALYNDCKYGFRVKGHRMEMTLIRSVPHPSSAVITVDDSGKPLGSVQREYTDLGRHTLRYAIQPHAGHLDEATLTARARQFNTPLRFHDSVIKPATTTVPSGSWLNINHPGLELTTCKKAEDRTGIILRLCNVTPQKLETTIECCLPFKAVWETNLIEEERLRHEITGPTAFAASFGAFEVKTFLLEI
jgi:alpha-mannosidase